MTKYPDRTLKWRWIVGFFQRFGESRKTWTEAAQDTKALQEQIYLLSHSAEDGMLIWKHTPLCYPGDGPACFNRPGNTFCSKPQDPIGFGTLALLHWWDIRTALSTSVQTHQFAPAWSSFTQTVRRFLPRLAAQCSSSTKNRAGLSIGDFFAWATAGWFRD